ncbi:MAG: GTP pyrophosphokinase [Bacteroidetes bacterium HLUCCA01]|nr:MAG: GTP pyrophosphokinase [Bacteroidetes bacterium HLUCCA01]
MADHIVTIDFSELRSYELEPKQRQELDDLLAQCHANFDETDDDLIHRAFVLSYLSHRDTIRASGEPYYLHPLEVAHIVIREMSLDDVSVAAALLHDTVEDTSISLAEIKTEFGTVVAHLIDGMTKISGVLKSRESKQAETFMKLLMSMAEDLRVVLIKFSDRLHNMRTLKHLPKAKQIKIATETAELYAPLAHRFGLFRLKSELEDLSFRAIDSQGYRFISRKLREKKDAREKFIEEFMQPIRDQLYKVGFNFEIKGRPKSIYSIYRKMVTQQKPFEDIYDLFAIRIILDPPHTREDCWRVYSYITDTYTPIPERFRDFLSVPKANGYQSLHTTVFSRNGAKVEIQIRTRQMDEIAEKGLAAHWKYKEGSGGSSSIDRFVHWVRDVLDNPRPDAASEFVQDFALNLFSDEIYIFTPKGQLLTLPKGATPIDFAFEVHSEVGERALAAKVNGKMVPLRQKLQSGDQVEIITGKNSNLNPDWINDVVTHKAKSRIRQFINMKERKAIEDGREIWVKKAGKQNLEISDQDLVKVANKLKYPSINKLYYDMGLGAFDVNTLARGVKDFLSRGRIEEEKVRLERITDEEIQDQYYDNARTAGSMRGLLVNGELTDVKYSYSKCCNPIPGDDVIGFLSRNGDVKIHRTNCNNVTYLLKNDSERMVEIGWPKARTDQFIGAVRIIGEDRVGLVNDITTLISQSMKTNMKGINVNSEEGMFEGTLIIYVEDIAHLERVIKRILKVPGVKQAYRFE